MDNNGSCDNNKTKHKINGIKKTRNMRDENK